MIWSAFVAPLVVVVLLALTPFTSGRRRLLLQRTLARWSWLAVVPAGVVVVLGDGAVHRLEWLLLGTSVQVDAIARPLLGLATLLYGLGLAFVPRAKTKRPQVLAGFLLLCFVGNIGVFLAADVITFYLSFTIVSFVGYAAVIHTGTKPSRRAGTIYLVLTVLGESAVLAALLLVASTGTLAVRDVPAAVEASPDGGLIVLLLIVGFGVKAGTVPLHVWLPLAHPAAPTPASALLSGVMLKAGLVGWLRFLPLGEGDGETVWGATLLVLALAGGFLAVPVGLLQDDPKVVLAYSSISQMGFITVLVGAALVDPALAPACTAAAVVYALHHGLVKGALFLGVQAWDAERLPRWVAATGMAVAGLSLAGMPFTSGYFAKYVAKEATGGAVVPFTSVELAAVLPWVGVGSTLLLVRFAIVMWRRERKPRPTPVSRDAVWLVLCGGAVVPVWFLARSGDSAPTVPPWLAAGPFVDQSWPVALGLGGALLAAAVARSPRFASSRVAHPRGDVVPPGDIVVIEERLVVRGLHLVDRGFSAARRTTATARDRLSGTLAPVTALFDTTQRTVGTWAGTGVLLLAATAGAVVWAWFAGTS